MIAAGRRYSADASCGPVGSLAGGPRYAYGRRPWRSQTKRPSSSSAHHSLSVMFADSPAQNEPSRTSPGLLSLSTKPIASSIVAKAASGEIWWRWFVTASTRQSFAYLVPDRDHGRGVIAVVSAAQPSRRPQIGAPRARSAPRDERGLDGRPRFWGFVYPDSGVRSGHRHRVPRRLFDRSGSSWS